MGTAGVNNNLVRPGDPGKLPAKIEATVRDHQGPFWGIENPEYYPGVADVSLVRYGLVRSDDCTPLVTNMEDKQRVKICRLRRN